MNKYAQSCTVINPKHVTIREPRVEEHAARLASLPLEVPSWRNPAFPESDEHILEFLGVVNSVNFCFTDFRTHQKFDMEYPEGSGKIWPGAFGMIMCFKRALDEGIPVIDPQFLMRITEKEAEDIFRHKNTPIPMLSQRVANLRNVGLMLWSRFRSFENIFRINNFKFLDIVENLWEFDAYRDSSFMRTRMILFMKRAQLYPMMYHGRATSSQGQLQPIRDSENFGPIADYEVPKILRYFGILLYSLELADAVDSGFVLKRDSLWEIEIRAQTVNAMSLLLSKVNEKRPFYSLPSITMAELDYAIWNMGRSPEFKQLRHHYTYTTAY